MAGEGMLKIGRHVGQKKPGDGVYKPYNWLKNHRLSTISQLDRLVVIEKGNVVESGTHGRIG